MSLALAERRRASRTRVHLDADYGSKSLELSCQVVCISRTGLFLNSDYLDELGSIVALNLRLPTEPAPVRLAGRVVRVVALTQIAGMGIQFTDLSWRTRQSIVRFVEEANSQRLS